MLAVVFLICDMGINFRLYVENRMLSCKLSKQIFLLLAFNILIIILIRTLKYSGFHRKGFRERQQRVTVKNTIQMLQTCIQHQSSKDILLTLGKQPTSVSWYFYL